MLSHYLSATSLSWDVMVNMTKVELELTSDLYIYMFFKKDMGGGVSYISKTCSKANKKQLKSYDLKQESKHIIYLDANELYRYVMPKFLPTGGFK